MKLGCSSLNPPGTPMPKVYTSLGSYGAISSTETRIRSAKQ